MTLTLEPNPQRQRAAGTRVRHCTNCGSGLSPEDRYCQDCGIFLESGLAVSSPPTMREGLDSFLARVSPSAAKSVVALPAVAGITLLVVLIPVLVYWATLSYGDISVGYMSDEAAKALKEGRPDQTVAIIDRISINHSLRKDQLLLFNKGRLSLADQMIAQSRWSEALQWLSKISADFPDYEQVKERMQVCRDSMSQKPTPANPKSESSKPHNHKSRMAAVAAAVESQTKHPAPSAPSASTPDTTASSTAPNTQTGQPTTQLSDHPIDNNASGSSTLPNYSHKDVVRYNELMAGYFSTRHAANSEPPTIREWVREGRPKF